MTNPATLKRMVYNFFLGLGYDPSEPRSVFRVKLGGPETTDQIISSLGFPAHEWITQANFPLQPRPAVEEDEIVIHDPCCSFSKEEGLVILAQKGLLRPNYEHALRFARQHGKATTSAEKPFVLFLHEDWWDPFRRPRFLSLFRDPECRGLDLRYSADRFSELCVLAGVRYKPSAV